MLATTLVDVCTRTVELVLVIVVVATRDTVTVWTDEMMSTYDVVNFVDVVIVVLRVTGKHEQALEMDESG